MESRFQMYIRQTGRGPVQLSITLQLFVFPAQRCSTECKSLPACRLLIKVQPVSVPAASPQQNLFLSFARQPLVSHDNQLVGRTSTNAEGNVLAQDPQNVLSPNCPQKPFSPFHRVSNVLLLTLHDVSMGTGCQPPSLSLMLTVLVAAAV